MKEISMPEVDGRKLFDFLNDFGVRSWPLDVLGAIWIVIWYNLMLIGCTVLLWFVHDVFEFVPSNAVVGSLVGALVCFVVAWTEKHKYEWYGSYETAHRRPIEWFTYVFLLVVTWLLGCLCATTIARMGDPAYAAYARSMNHASKAVVYAYSLAVAPLCEEMLIHDTIYRGLRRSHSIVPSAFLVSVLFAAMHSTRAQLPLGVLMSMTSCLVYERTHSIAACVGGHVFVNMLSTFLAPRVRFPLFMFEPVFLIPMYLLAVSMIVLLLVYLPRCSLFASRFAALRERRQD